MGRSSLTAEYYILSHSSYHFLRFRDASKSTFLSRDHAIFWKRPSTFPLQHAVLVGPLPPCLPPSSLKLFPPPFPRPDILYLCHTCQDTHARHAPPGTTYVTSTNYHIFIYLHSCHIWNLLCYLFFWPRSVNVLQVCSLKNFSSWAREASRKTDTYLPPPSALGGSQDPKKTIYIQILWYRFNIKLSHFNLRFI